MNFQEKYNYIKNNNKIDISKFDSATEITNMIDFINKETETKAQKRGDEELDAITKFLSDSVTKKIFFMGK